MKPSTAKSKTARNKRARDDTIRNAPTTGRTSFRLTADFPTEPDDLCCGNDSCTRRFIVSSAYSEEYEGDE